MISVAILSSSKHASHRLKSARNVSVKALIIPFFFFIFLLKNKKKTKKKTKAKSQTPPQKTAVIAVLHGISYGLALDISLACDMRLCSRETRFAVKEVDIGLAADIGTLTRLPHANLPASFVKDVALTAREFLAPEALAVGLVSAVHGSKELALGAAVDKAALIACKSPVAVVGTKEVLNFSREHGVADGEFCCLSPPIIYCYCCSLPLPPPYMCVVLLHVVFFLCERLCWNCYDGERKGEADMLGCGKD